ncbi:MAG TPA: hemolysin family protein [Patescibacteria group bacterium]|nr:hemolysin family protein [Patescibacteria group bacterium]
MNDTVRFSDHLPLVALVAVLLFFSAFFSGSEAAFFSLSRFSVLELESGGKRRRAIAALLREPRMLLVTILFGNLLVNIASTSAVTALAISLFGEKGVGFAMIVMIFLILVFGEITPKSLAMKNAVTFAVAAVPLLRLLMIALTPVRLILNGIAGIAVDRSRRIFGDSSDVYGARELATAVELGHHEGLFDRFETQLLTKLFLFSETTVREIMTPRVEVFSLDVGTGLNETIIQVRDRGFSRIPLYEGQSDQIVGLLLAKDLLRYSREERVSLRDIMRPALFAPDSKKIRELFGELIAARQHMVMVVDEFGSFDGIATLEDILEEIFGQIRDRREPRVEEFLRSGDNSIVAEGSMLLKDLNEIFETTLDSREVETVAGYLVEHIGKIPRGGESFIFEGFRFLVLSAEPTRINKIKIEWIADAGEWDVAT